MTTDMPKAPSVLNRLADITRIRDIEIFETSILKTLVQLLKVPSVSLYRLGSDNRPLHLIRYQETLFAGSQHQVRTEINEIRLTDIEIPEYIKLVQQWIEANHTHYNSVDEHGHHTVYPILGIVRIVGFIALSTPHKLSETESLIIRSILAITHNFHSLLEENQKDKLTGLLNRKTFEDSINKLQSIPQLLDPPEQTSEQEQRKPTSQQNWLAVVDIDHFKRINDTRGHVFGDEILLLMANIMRASFRKFDLLFRFGGEEFVIVLRNLNREQTQQSLQRFLDSVANFHFPQIDTVTVSIGATEVDNHNLVAADIVGRADQALYYGKEHGRNQLHFFEDLVASNAIENKIEGSIELF
ncbi:MAG: GGDEF domain-containing protein [Methylococcales bacterium]|nr:GGDEF domain-containing protein [Methylococcales bacterium]